INYSDQKKFPVAIQREFYLIAIYPRIESGYLSVLTKKPCSPNLTSPSQFLASSFSNSFRYKGDSSATWNPSSVNFNFNKRSTGSFCWWLSPRPYLVDIGSSSTVR